MIFIGGGLVYFLAVALDKQQGLTLGFVLIGLGVVFLIAHYMRKKKDANNSAI